MKLYIAKDNYINKLKNLDNRVLVNSHGTTTRPYYFLELKINDTNFAIPFSSPKQNVRYNPFTQIFINGKDQQQGRLFLLNMIPFKREHFDEVDIHLIKNDNYRFLLQDQLRFLSDKKDEIERKASIIFRARYNPNHFKYSMLQKNAIDYKNLINHLKLEHL